MKTIFASVFIFLLAAAAATAQNHCTTPALIVPGVECNLVSTGAGLLLPCSSPIGFYNLPVGTMLLIDYIPSSCVSFCQQGMESDIFCAQVEGGQYAELCAGESLAIGDPGNPGVIYAWEPSLYISCTDCPTAVVSPPSDAIYQRTETSAAGSTTIFYNIEVVTCTGVGALAPSAVSVYPVPALEEIQVQGFDFERFVIVNTAGRVVLDGSAGAAKTIRVGALPPGLYYLHLWDEGRTAVCKFVKAD